MKNWSQIGETWKKSQAKCSLEGRCHRLPQKQKPVKICRQSKE